jgi:TRAP-type transport system periplasmic protein
MKAHRPTGSRMERRRFLKLSLAAGAAASFTSIAAPAVAQRVRALRFGHPVPPDIAYHKACLMFADEVARLSSNKMRVEVYPSSQLGSVAEMLSAVKVGSLDMMFTTPANYTSFIKPLDVFVLPYIVRSTDRLRKALDGDLGKEVIKMGEGAGFEFLGYLLLGSRHIVNRVRPIYKPADCHGLKLRVLNSQVYIQAFRALGGSTVVMDPLEIYVALQQGVVDGFEFPLPDLVSYKLYEVSKYLSLDGHMTDFHFISMSKVIWDGLSSEQRGIISQAMRTAVDHQWKMQPTEINNALAKLKTLLQVNEISQEDKKLFMEATRPVYKQFESTIGGGFLELAIRELS